MGMNRVVIDVEARFIDNVSKQAGVASDKLEDVEKAAQGAKKGVDALGKGKATPKIDADDSKISQKLKKTESWLKKLGGSKTTTIIDAMDKASSKINKITTAAKTLAGKTWNTVVKIKDYATAPLTKIKNHLFSIKSLVAAITMGVAAKQFVLNPINLADQYSSAQIGFTTLLGEAGGQDMMNQIDQFAKATPFKTSGVISNVQKMMAYGWEAERVIADMETIGDAAAATGKGDEGLTSIVYALSEIRSKGKLSTQELNQLASAGIKAKQYLAEGLGFGTDDAGLMKLSEALEDGAIGANQAVELILKGMEEFDGMMDKTANETVEGLKSQIEDAFEINVFRRWGQGLQAGAKEGLGSLVGLLNDSEGALQDLGDTLYEVGRTASEWLADKLNGTISKIKEITSSFDFKNASLGEKIKMLWNGVIADPISRWWDETVVPWWDNKAVPWLADKAGDIGEAIGSGLGNGLQALLGVDVVDAAEDGISIGASFARGFAEGFDGSAVAEAFVDAIGKVWDALPWYGKLLVGGYGVSKVGGGIGSLIGGIGNIAGLVGSASGGTGLLGFGAKAGIAMGAGNLAGGASLGAGSISALGLGATAGYLSGGLAMFSGIGDLYQSYKTGDVNKNRTGTAKIGGTAAGAAIGAALGSIIPGLGTIVGGGIGAGIGSLYGWWKSSEIEAEAEKAAEDAAKKAAEIQQRAADGLKAKFGDIRMSAAEVQAAVSEMIGQELINKAYAASDAIDTMNSSFQTMEKTGETLKKSVWLYTLRKETELTDDEITALKDTTKAYADSAGQYMTDAEYASSSSIKGLMGDSIAAKKVLKESSDYYKKQSDTLEGERNRLTETLDKALEDRVITVDEEKSINEIRDSIAKITRQIQQDEYLANMNIITAKYGSGSADMSLDSFEAMQQEMRTQASQMSDAFWQEFGAASIGIEEGSKEWELLLKATLDNMANVWQDAGDLGLDTLQSKWKDELGIFSKDLSTILKNNTLEEIMTAADGLSEETKIQLDKWLESMSPTTEQIESLAKRYEEAGLEVPKALASYLDTVEFYEALSGGTEAIEKYFEENQIELQPNVKIDENWTGITDQLVFEDNLEFACNAYADIQWEYNPLTGEVIDPGHNFSFNSSALVAIGWTWNDFDKTWVSPDGQYHFRTRAITDVDYETDPFPGTSEFAILDKYSKSTSVTVEPKFSVSRVFSSGMLGVKNAFQFSPKVSITPSYDYVPFGEQQLGPRKFRGGIVGPDGPRAFAAGGMVRGGAQLVTVAEEGTPEMIIPLGSQRRERGIKLWKKAGEMMGIRGFARGGRTDGGDEGLRFIGMGGGSDEPISGQTVQIEVGGITVEIHVDATGEKNIAQAIKEQAAEIAETVAGIMADAMSGQFENTPLRGGI